MKKIIISIIFISFYMFSFQAKAIKTPAVGEKAPIVINFFYTPEILNKFGSASTVYSKLLVLLRRTNLVYSLNETGLYVKLGVFTALPANTETTFVNGNALNYFANNKYVLDLRNKYRADFSVLLTQKFVVENVGSVDGVAFTPGFSYSLARANTAFSVVGLDTYNYNTLVHELGHNMSLGHGHPGDNASNLVFPYGQGFGIENTLTTVMAYPQVYGTTTQVEYFSTPNRSVGGNVIGNSATADAERAVINLKGSYVNFGEMCILSPNPDYSTSSPGDIPIVPRNRCLRTILKKK